MISALRHEQMAKVGSRLRLHPELVGVTFPGPHDQADRAEVLRIAMKLPDWPTVVHDHNELVEGIGWVLDWLETFPGDGWHDRWIAAGANTDPDSWILRRHGQDPRIAPSVRAIAVSGIRTLIVARVILPDYPYFSALKTAIGYRQILAQQDPDLRQRLQDGMDRRHMSAKTQHDCWTVLARVMLHTGHDLPAITKNDLFAFRSAQGTIRLPLLFEDGLDLGAGVVGCLQGVVEGHDQSGLTVIELVSLTRDEVLADTAGILERQVSGVALHGVDGLEHLLGQEVRHRRLPRPVVLARPEVGAGDWRGRRPDDLRRNGLGVVHGGVDDGGGLLPLRVGLAGRRGRSDCDIGAL